MQFKRKTAWLALMLVFVMIFSLVFSLFLNLAVSADGVCKPEEIPELNCISKTASMSIPPEPDKADSYRNSAIMSADSIDRTQKTDIFFGNGFYESLNGNEYRRLAAAVYADGRDYREVFLNTVMIC